MKHLLSILKEMNRAATARDEMSAYISTQSRPPEGLAAPSKQDEGRLGVNEDSDLAASPAAAGAADAGRDL